MVKSATRRAIHKHNEKASLLCATQYTTTRAPLLHRYARYACYARYARYACYLLPAFHHIAGTGNMIHPQSR